ncbi:hypothetical protein PRZ48_012458 [Zasmidium cellare]|uniref:F-box domain-containing protein n=1 Tax=Zasmidium cellare TaxID=395010 RepID=A0ABR0E5C9_ZASCE|nr:hypothetical protein PRZ48_012458 [Zasmidium cellare]
MVSAAERVHGLPEVLEMILDNLPTNDLLRVESVSQNFRNGIKASKHLQEKLFFRPEKLCGVEFPYETVLPWKQEPEEPALAKSKWIVHQIKFHLKRLHQVPLNTFFWDRFELRCSRFVGGITNCLPINILKALHPAMAELSLHRNEPTDSEAILTVSLYEHLSPSNKMAMTLYAPNPSWRRMLLKQCPCTEIVLCLKVRRRRDSVQDLMGKRFPANTLMGEIMDYCASQPGDMSGGAGVLVGGEVNLEGEDEEEVGEE